MGKSKSTKRLEGRLAESRELEDDWIEREDVQGRKVWQLYSYATGTAHIEITDVGAGAFWWTHRIKHPGRCDGHEATLKRAKKVSLKLLKRALSELLIKAEEASGESPTP